MGGCGKRGPRARWHIAGGASQWRFQASHRGGFGGIAKKAGSLTADASADSSKGWGAEEVIAQRSGSAARPGKTAGTSDARGSSVPTALDMQKRAQSRRRTASPGTRSEPYAGCGIVTRTEIQPSGEPQDEGGFLASGSQCTV